MSAEKLTLKYIASTQQVLDNLEIIEDKISLERSATDEVVEHVKAYLEDAKYYRDQGKFEVSLASVAYSEGLLDALRMLGAVGFEWPKSREKKREE